MERDVVVGYNIWSRTKAGYSYRHIICVAFISHIVQPLPLFRRSAKLPYVHVSNPSQAQPGYMPCLYLHLACDCIFQYGTEH